MSTTQNAKRFWIWMGVILLFEIAAFTLWKRWYWFFPSHEVSELYSKYEGTEGVNASYVKDYRINDTVFVNVTLIEALDPAHWETLKEEFKIDSLSQTDDNTVAFWFAPRNHYNEPMDAELLNNDIVAVDYYKHAIAVFELQSEKQIEAIFAYQILNTNKKTKK